MKLGKNKRMMTWLLMGVSIFLVISGILLLLQSFTHYNALSLQRQDDQLRDMAKAADEYIELQLKVFHDNLSYVVKRRGFTQAESKWKETGDSSDLLIRMQENLVTEHPFIHGILARQDDTIFLSTTGTSDYYFPRSDGTLQPCYSGNGTLYLAFCQETSSAQYAALLDVEKWYAAMAEIYTNGKIRLMLLGSREKILLHQWRSERCARHDRKPQHGAIPNHILAASLSR